MDEQQQLGRYQLVAEIGRGSTGIVYKALDPIIDRVVAIKSIDFRRLGEGQALAQERFFQEAKSAGRLSHPNIVTIFDAGEAQGCAYIAMELLDGLSLREMLDERLPVSVGRALEITAQVGRGLAYAHENGIVHRDIKPANVILVGSRRAKITDFGIAHIATGSGTVEGELAGSPKYMSPEQVRSEVLDGRSDLFSLGAMLYEMLTGQQPFDDNNVSTIMQAVLDRDPPAPSTLNPQVPPEVDRLTLRLLAKLPEDRHPSARALLRELAALLKNFNAKGLEPLAKEETLAREKRRGRRAKSSNEGDATVVMDAPLPQDQAPRRPRGLPMAAFYGMGIAAVAVLLVIGLSLHQTTPKVQAAPVVQPVVQIAQTDATLTEVAAMSEPSTTIEEVKMVDANASEKVPPADIAAAIPEKLNKQAVKVPTKKLRKPAVVNAPLAVAAVSKNAAPAESATIIVAASPWGEVLVDGQSHGTTPPLSTISVSPGKHRIEIRNGNLPAHTVEMSLSAGDTRRIKHKFE